MVSEMTDHKLDTGHGKKWKFDQVQNVFTGNSILYNKFRE